MVRGGGGRTTASGLVLGALALVASVTVAGATATGPTAAGFIFPQDHPDPAMVHTANGVYTYSTTVPPERAPGGVGVRIGVWFTTTAGGLSLVGDALSDVPAWASDVGGSTWAPAVFQFAGKWHLYFVAARADNGQKCIGHAEASSPAGPFAHTSASPMVCQQSLNGSIDPEPFIDADGTAYLLWKSEENATGGSSRLWSAKLTGTGRNIDGSATAILAADRGAEGTIGGRGRVIENPSLVPDHTGYWLFFSGGWFDTADYHTGIAHCETPRGPCTKEPDRWHIKSAGELGPGGMSVQQDLGGHYWGIYHSWGGGPTSYPGGTRRLHLRPIVLGDGLPTWADSGQLSITNPGFYDGAVAWAAFAGITVGVTPTEFSPAEYVNRGQAVTFLWRAANEPAATPGGFQDVSPNDFFGTAVGWAATTEPAITLGINENEFGPNRVVTRGEAVTFLHRFFGEPEPATQPDFSDVNSTDFFADAVAWAAETGVTRGTTDTTFSPTLPVTRGEMVTFLWRSVGVRATAPDAWFADVAFSL